MHDVSARLAASLPHDVVGFALLLVVGVLAVLALVRAHGSLACLAARLLHDLVRSALRLVLILGAVCAVIHAGGLPHAGSTQCHY